MLTPTELTLVGFTIVLSKLFVLFCVYLFCSFALAVHKYVEMHMNIYAVETFWLTPKTKSCMVTVCSTIKQNRFVPYSS